MLRPRRLSDLLVKRAGEPQQVVSRAVSDAIAVAVTNSDSTALIVAYPYRAVGAQRASDDSDAIYLVFRPGRPTAARVDDDGCYLAHVRAVCCSEPDLPLCVRAFERFLADGLPAEQPVDATAAEDAEEGTDDDGDADDDDDEGLSDFLDDSDIDEAQDVRYCDVDLSDAEDADDEPLDSDPAHAGSVPLGSWVLMTLHVRSKHYAKPERTASYGVHASVVNAGAYAGTPRRREVRDAASESLFAFARDNAGSGSDALLAAVRVQVSGLTGDGDGDDSSDSDGDGGSGDLRMFVTPGYGQRGAPLVLVGGAGSLSMPPGVAVWFGVGLHPGYGEQGYASGIVSAMSGSV